MKEITCIQQYVIDNLINDKRLSVENLIDAVIKTCSTEQFNNILSILIKAHTTCKDKVNFVEIKENNLALPVLVLKKPKIM
jgi:hypothetical protein